MSKFIHIELPESEKRKFHRWVNKLTVQNRANLKRLVVGKTEKMVRLTQETLRNNRSVNNAFLKGSIRARYRSDHLGSEIDIDRSKAHRKPGSKYTIYVNYAEHVEFGTRPHIIRPKNGKAIGWGKIVKNVNGVPHYEHVARYVNHPGSRAKPFFYPNAKKIFREFILELNKMGFR